MTLLLAFGFALGVLATALAGEYERRKARCPFMGSMQATKTALDSYRTLIVGSFSGETHSTYTPFQDSTLDRTK